MMLVRMVQGNKATLLFLGIQGPRFLPNQLHHPLGLGIIQTDAFDQRFLFSVAIEHDLWLGEGICNIHLMVWIQ